MQTTSDIGHTITSIFGRVEEVDAVLRARLDHGTLIKLCTGCTGRRAEKNCVRTIVVLSLEGRQRAIGLPRDWCCSPESLANLLIAQESACSNKKIDSLLHTRKG